jgi:general stress protein 26
MAKEKEAALSGKFWKALRDDRTVMLGLAGVDEGHAQPMTALLEGEGARGAIWFFSAKDVDLVKSLGAGKPAVAHFVAKNHGIFASVHGKLAPDNDRGVIERLWNPFVAAWYEGGKDDPKLQLLRFNPERAQIWENENSLLAGIKIMLGQDPKSEYRDKVAEVTVS